MALPASSRRRRPRKACAAAWRAATAALCHRRPDDFGIRIDGSVGLVHTRLSIIDLAGGHQPIVSPDAQLSAVVNGEIYNYVELRREFRERSAPEPLSASDSESVMQVYAAEGVDGFRRLHGMFALALLDRRRRCLVLARDRLGIAAVPEGAGPHRQAVAAPVGPAPRAARAADAKQAGLPRADAAGAGRAAAARAGPGVGRQPRAARMVRRRRPAATRRRAAPQRRSGGFSELVWGLMQFAIWHRIFIERGGVRPALDEDPLDWIR